MSNTNSRTLHIYIRVSSEVQTKGESLNAQRLLGIRKAEELGYQYVIYADEGKSAKDDNTTNRPALTKLLGEIDAGVVTDIFVTEIDRLTRSPELHFKLKLKFIGRSIIVHTSSGPIDFTDYDQEFMADLRALMGKRENSLKSARSIRGMKEAAKKGRWIGVMVPYGYRKDENRLLTVDEEEAKIYRQMVTWCLQGHGTNTIAQKLNTLDIPTRGRKTLQNGTKVVNRYTKQVRQVTNDEFVWRAGTIYCVLTNTIYKGERKYKDEIIMAPKLIDDKTWAKVQEQLKKNRVVAVNHGKHDYLLKGLIRCGRCGSNLYGRMKSDERTYMCSSKRYKSCGLRSPNLDRLEKAVWDRVVNSGQYLMDLQIEWTEGGRQAAIDKNTIELDELRAELLALQNRELKLLELYELDRINLEKYDSRKKELLKAISDVNTKISVTENNKAALLQHKSKVEELFYGLEGLWNIRCELEKLSFEEKRQLLHQLNVDIIINWIDSKKAHDIEITFSVNGFTYNKEASLLAKGNSNQKSEPHPYWTMEQSEFLTRMMRPLANYSEGFKMSEAYFDEAKLSITVSVSDYKRSVSSESIVKLLV